MSQSKVNKDNYIVIQGWMITDLKLKGNALVVYACIYGFSQLEGQTFSGSLQYLADWTNSTKQGVIKCLKTLVENGLVEKTEKVINNVKFCEYHATKFNEVLNKVDYPIKQSLTGGGEQSLPNNINKDNLNNKLENNNTSDYEQIAKMFFDICKLTQRIPRITAKRKDKLKTRLKDYTVEDFKKVFEKTKASRFLTGHNKENWTATFDWLIEEANMVKVLEGNYDDKKPVAAPANSSKFGDLSHLKAPQQPVNKTLDTTGVF